MKPSNEYLNKVRILIRVFQKRSWKGGKEVREMVKAEDVTKRMKAIRVSRGLTTEDVGRLLGKDRSAVSRQELNPLGLSLKTLLKYAEIYGCNVADFLVPNHNTNCGV